MTPKSTLPSRYPATTAAMSQASTPGSLGAGPAPLRAPSRRPWGQVRCPVYWLPRPPYLRWAAAALLVLGALAWDLRSPAVELRPFASRPVRAGEALDASAVAWREVPAGLLALPQVDPGGAAGWKNS